MAQSTLLYSENLTVRTASGNTGGTGIIVPDFATSLYCAYNVTAVSGTSPSLTINLQELNANGVWDIVGQSTPITTTMNNNFGNFTGQGLPTRLPFRIGWVISGTSPSFTFQLCAYACG